MIRLLKSFSWFKRLLNAKRREIDITVLWPAIKKQASAHKGKVNLYRCRVAFCLHVVDDPAWTDLTTSEIVELINNLN